MVKNIFLLGVGFIILTILGFSQMVYPDHNPIYFENFEGITTGRKLNRDFQVWENGAILQVFLEEGIFSSGGKSLGVEAISANPLNHAMDGSLYHTLSTNNSDWSEGSGVRFWVNNPNNVPLMLTFNFKEKYREYWAIAESGIFYFQDNQNLILQQEIDYYHLVIPSRYEGSVVIPFASFSVPEWNTAHSNGFMDLDNIDSYAIGVRIGENLPTTFYIDDIEVFDQTIFRTLTIKGPDRIQAPESGVLLESFSAYLGVLDQVAAVKTEVQWSIQTGENSLLSITEDGVLSIPSETTNEIITLTAFYEYPEYLFGNQVIIVIENQDGQLAEEVENDSVTVEKVTSGYSVFSTGFDRWAQESRPLFILIMVSGVLVFLVFLSSVQRFMK